MKTLFLLLSLAYVVWSADQVPQVEPTDTTVAEAEVVKVELDSVQAADSIHILPEPEAVIGHPLLDSSTTQMLISPDNRSKILTSSFITAHDQALIKTYYDVRDSLKASILRQDLQAYVKHYDYGHKELIGFSWMYSKEKVLSLLILGRAEEIYKDSVMINYLMRKKRQHNSKSVFCGLSKPQTSSMSALEGGATQDLDRHLWAYFSDHRMKIARNFHKSPDIQWIISETQCVKGMDGRITPTQANQLKLFISKFPQSPFVPHAKSWEPTSRTWNAGGLVASFGVSHNDYLEQPANPLVDPKVGMSYQINFFTTDFVFGVVANYNTFNSQTSIRFSDTTVAANTPLEMNTFQFMAGTPIKVLPNFVISPYGAIGTTTLKTTEDFYTQERGTWLPKHSQVALGTGLNLDYFFTHLMMSDDGNRTPAGSVGIRLSAHYDYHGFSQLVNNLSDHQYMTKVELLVGIIGMDKD